MNQNPCTVVVVDDEPDILSVVCAVLEDDGYNVVCLSHPKLVSEEIKGNARLFILDMMLPGLSGIALAERLQDDRFGQTPMIAMSASPAMLRLAEDSHLFQDTLPKPFELARLLDLAEQYAT